MATFSRDHRDHDIELPPVVPPSERSVVLSVSKIHHKPKFLKSFKFPIEGKILSYTGWFAVELQEAYFRNP